MATTYIATVDVARNDTGSTLEAEVTATGAEVEQVFGGPAIRAFLPIPDGTTDLRQAVLDALAVYCADNLLAPPTIVIVRSNIL